MIKITIKDLIYIVPDMINIFLSGFIFVTIYLWLNSKTMNISLITIWSLFISQLIKTIYQVVHLFIFSNILFSPPIKVIIYSITGLVASFIFTYLKKTKFITKLLYKTNNKSINSDIFDDIIDYDKITMMQIHIKNTNIMYIGKFCFREENGLDSWIVLTDYTRFDSKNKKSLFCPSDNNINSSVSINLHDIQSLEIIYDEGSKIWEKLHGINSKKTD